MITKGDLKQAVIDVALSRAMHRVLMLIVPYACVLVGLDVAAHYGDATGAYLPVQFFMSEDHSFGEFLEYSMTGSAALLMLLRWQRARAPFYLASAILFAWLTIDNWVEVHEQVGLALAPVLPVPAWLPLKANHLGELFFFAAVGAVWLAGTVSAYWRSEKREAVYGLMIGACIVLTAVFGVFIDTLTSLGEHTPNVLNFLAFLEDEGEFTMLMLTFAVSVGIYDVERRSDTAAAGTPKGLRTASA
ncbi:hypothetical protein [Erythrobacter colymbi]|uniref:hypothetical protein n=1 Tax=Erythrobacter colymbi TaxID=1161202 RepID=UPI000A366E14|nr:hypothetical protein [Erythrobacter colymbi]